MWFEKVWDRVAAYFGYEPFSVADDLAVQVGEYAKDLNACEHLLNKLGVTEVSLVPAQDMETYELHAELGPNPDHRMVELLYEHCDQLTIDAPPESEPLPPTYHFGQRTRVPVTMVKADDMAPDPLTEASIEDRLTQLHNDPSNGLPDDELTPSGEVPYGKVESVDLPGMWDRSDFVDNSETPATNFDYLKNEPKGFA